MNNICEVMQKYGIADADSKEGIALCLNCPEPRCLLGEDHERHYSQDKVVLASKLAGSGLGIAGIAKLMHKSKRQVLRYLEVSNA